MLGERDGLKLGLFDTEGLVETEGLVDGDTDGLFDTEGLVDGLTDGEREGERDELGEPAVARVYPL